jgi:copper chaperone NosL
MAAITMEGYTPPMIGTSQFMNFYITAWPSWGAAALAGGMVLGILALLFGSWRLRVAGSRQATRSGALLATVVAGLMVSACSAPEPAVLVVGGDTCEFCGMLVSDPRFAAQVVTDKGKTYMFDAIECFVAFLAEEVVPAEQIHSTWVVNFDQPDQWLPAAEAYYLQAIDLHSPMGANLLAFRTQAALDAVKSEVRGMQRRYADLPALVIETGLIDRVHAKNEAGGMHMVNEPPTMDEDAEMGSPAGQ